MADSVYNPLSGADEILFKDIDGGLKVLRGEAVTEWQPPAAEPSPPVSTAARPAAPAVPPSPFDPLVDAVISELQIPLDPVRSRRLRSIVLSRFKDIRDAIEIREVLLRAPAAGGLGLSGGMLDRAAGIIDRQYQRFTEGKRQQHDLTYAALSANVGPAAPPPLPKSVPVPLTPLPAKIAPAIPPAPKVSPITRPLSVPPAQTATRPPPPAIEQPAMPQKSFVPASAIPPVRPVFAPVAAQPLGGPAVAPSVPQVKSAPSVPAKVQPDADAAAVPTPPVVQPAAAPPVRYHPKLVGPLEELRDLTVQDFRRLDADPHQATVRIAEKIALLEQQSFAHKAAAIAAWRKSEVFTRYMELAAAAMDDKRPITQVLAERPAGEKPPLTVVEFEAIADFNRTLRF